jgi:polar amino acid transport system substrate-binding protein
MRQALIAGALLALFAAGCGAADSPVGTNTSRFFPKGVASTVPTTTTTGPECHENTSRPDVTESQIATEIERITRDGFVVGVDENTEGLGYRNPRTGVLEGFEVALAHEIARRLTGNPDAARLRTVVTANKVSAPASHEVDATISSVSMNCERRKLVAFSDEYFTAYHELLVRDGAGITSKADLPGKRVCVTAGSSSIKLLADSWPTAKPVIVPTRSECLVELQQARADAYLGHDTFLWGLHDQDVKHTRLIEEHLNDQHYGIAIAKDRPALVVAVNRVLADLCADRTLQQLADDNLGVHSRPVACGTGAER